MGHTFYKVENKGRKNTIPIIMLLKRLTKFMFDFKQLNKKNGFLFEGV